MVRKELVETPSQEGIYNNRIDYLLVRLLFCFRF